MISLELDLLGGFQARAAGRPVDVPGRKERALLAILALPPGELRSRDRLAGLLWSDRGDKQARDSLKSAISRLKTAFSSLHPAPIVSDREYIALDREKVAVDVAAFERLIGEGTPECIVRATGLYRGDLLDGVDVRDQAFEEWLLLERQRLRVLARDALGTLLDQHLASGARASAAVVAHRLLALDPLREGAHRALMQIYAEQGQATQALKQYQLCRDALQHELGVRPEAETERLYKSIAEKRGAVRPTVGESKATRPETTEPPGDFLRPEPGGAVSAKPTIAVLPFENLCGDPEQQYFSDGIAEDIITDLSKVSGLFVIARNSSFTYRGKAVRVQEVSQELGVRYVLEGSVRKAGNRVRIAAQLIDGTTGGHLWAERYDRDLTDIFAVQDEVTREIVAALAVKLTKSEQHRLARKGTDNLEAYDHYLRGRQLALQRNRTGVAEARPLLERAIALDPQFAPAYTMLAYTHNLDHANGWHDAGGKSLQTAQELAQMAVARDDDDPEAHWVLGWVLLLGRQHDRAMAEVRTALRCDPNFALAHSLLGQVLYYSGRAAEALQPLATAFRLDPNNEQDPHLHYLALAYFGLGRYEDAAAALKRRLVRKPDTDISRVLLAACYGYLGRVEEARAQWREVMRINPDYSLKHRRRVLPYKDPADFERIADGLRNAGLPE